MSIKLKEGLKSFCTCELQLYQLGTVTWLGTANNIARTVGAKTDYS